MDRDGREPEAVVTSGSGVAPLNNHVREEMRKMPRRDTKPELAVRKELYRRGIRYRVNLGGVPGRPDIALTRAKIAVFVDGCFWHACPVHGTLPKNTATGGARSSTGTWSGTRRRTQRSSNWDGFRFTTGSTMTSTR